MLVLASCTIFDLFRLNSPTRPKMAGHFEVREFHYAEGQFENGAFRYHLFVPRSLKPAEKYPLLVWLHGAGDGELDDATRVKYFDMILRDEQHIDKYRFFVLAVSSPRFRHGWTGKIEGTGFGTGRPSDMLEVTVDILQKTLHEYPIDRNRIYLAGISVGASACFEMAVRYPDLYAAVAPMAAGQIDESRGRLARLLQIPLWSFINKGERHGVEGVITAIQNAGGNAYLTVADMPGHDAWSAPLQNGIMDWMLAQRRGRLSWTPPGHDPWEWWQVLMLPCSLLVFLRLSWFVKHWLRRPKVLAVRSDEEDFSPRRRSPSGIENGFEISDSSQESQATMDKAPVSDGGRYDAVSNAELRSSFRQLHFHITIPYNDGISRPSNAAPLGMPDRAAVWGKRC